MVPKHPVSVFCQGCIEPVDLRLWFRKPAVNSDKEKQVAIQFLPEKPAAIHWLAGACHAFSHDCGWLGRACQWRRPGFDCDRFCVARRRAYVPGRGKRTANTGAGFGWRWRGDAVVVL